MNEEIYLGSMFSRDGRYEMDVERRIAAGNRVNGALSALMRTTLCTAKRAALLTFHRTMQFWYRHCYTAAKRGYCRRRIYKGKMNAVEM